MSTPVKLLRTIRFDGTDPRVFEIAAEPDEWACSGAFAFVHLSAQPAGKARQAFANGFLGVASFGRSTFATVGEATAEELAAMRDALSQHFVSHYGAPSSDAAEAAASEEIAFIADLCRDVPVNTVFTVRRVFDSRGQIKEEFRQITPPSGEPMHGRVWTIVDDTDGEAPRGA